MNTTNNDPTQSLTEPCDRLHGPIGSGTNHQPLPNRIIGDDTGNKGPHNAPARGAMGAPAPGLVFNATSHTLVMNTFLARLRKMSRAVLGTATAIQECLQKEGIRYRAALITLTYAPGQKWEAKDISRLCNLYRMWAKRKEIKISGVWVLELTQAGVPHYHLLLFIPRGYTPPLPDKQGWWRKGMTNAKWAKSPVGYIAKYASKGTAGDLPNGARLHGHIGLTNTMLALRSWFIAPAWLRKMCERGNRLKKVGSWWRDCVTRIEYRTPWVLDEFRADGPVLRWVGWTEEDVRFL